MAEKKKESQALDLSALDEAVKKQDEGIDVPIKGMDGKKPIGLTIRVAGPDSKRAQEAQDAMTDDLVAAQDLERPKASEAKRRGIQYLASITLGWEPTVKLDGKDMSYSPENAEKLYIRFKFIRDQVDKAAGNRALFIEG